MRTRGSRACRRHKAVSKLTAHEATLKLRDCLICNLFRGLDDQIFAGHKMNHLEAGQMCFEDGKLIPDG